MSAHSAEHQKAKIIAELKPWLDKMTEIIAVPDSVRKVESLIDVPGRQIKFIIYQHDLVPIERSIEIPWAFYD